MLIKWLSLRRMTFRFLTRKKKLLRFFTCYVFFIFRYFDSLSTKRRGKKIFLSCTRFFYVCTESRRKNDWKIFFFSFRLWESSWVLSQSACFDFKPRYSESHRFLECCVYFRGLRAIGTCGKCFAFADDSFPNIYW